jgi:nicotinamide-nucleotide amidase
MAGVTLTRAAVVAVGSELLTPSRADTNSLVITEHLNRLGIDVVLKMVVGDDREELSRAVRQALERVDLVICSGGLGPTDDDVTREAVASLLDRPLAEDETITAGIRRRYAARGFPTPMPEINRRQAMVPAGASVIENAHGSAPGLWIEDGSRLILLLPGPPRELEPMLRELVNGRLAERTPRASLRRRVVRMTGRTESQADEALQPLYRAWQDVAIPVSATILSGLGQIELHLSARAASVEAAETALDDAARQVVGVLGMDVYSTDGHPLEQVVGDLLVERGLRIGAAESCTGGLLTSKLTDVAGSSRYVQHAVVAYANAAKSALLGVPAELIAQHGAVSEPVARAMAGGILASGTVDVAVGVTGIAGPEGGSVDKPVGTVAVAVLAPGVSRTRVFRFIGGRGHVKIQAALAALDMVRRLLIEQVPSRAPAGTRETSRR